MKGRVGRERCDDCGARDGDRAPDGRILLVFHPGMEGDPKLCAPCIEARRPTLQPTLQQMLKRLQGTNPFTQPGGYSVDITGPGAGCLEFVEESPLQPVVEQLSRTVGGFDPHARSVPFTFVDPLEQLELGRIRAGFPVQVVDCADLVEGVLR